MRVYVYCLLFLTSITCANAQTEVQFSFGGTQDDIGRSAIQTDDNGYMILGQTYSYGQGNADILLTRTDSVGDILWSKTYGTTARDIGYKLRKDPNGDYLMICWVLNAPPSDDDWYVLKVDNNGTVLQEQFFGGADDDEVLNFEMTSDGGYIFSGSTRTFSIDAVDMWLIKTDGNLNVQWNKLYNTILQRYDVTKEGRVINLSTGSTLIKGRLRNRGTQLKCRR